ncbi:MAG: hypothetical protein WBB45_15520 [Cyclobacteriaceae bacterium]
MPPSPQGYDKTDPRFAYHLNPRILLNVPHVCFDMSDNFSKDVFLLSDWTGLRQMFP